jgi:hypothetical protein
MTGLSSLEARDLADHGIAVRDVVSVVTTTVDEFCSSRGIEAVDLLKVDAEGHDLAVLEGAATMLREARIAFVQFEFGGGNIDARTFIRDFLHVLGGSYAVSRVLFDGLEPVVYSEREEVFVTANYLAERRR